eukprot:6476708-Amphidinium_carterae.1
MTDVDSSARQLMSEGKTGSDIQAFESSLVEKNACRKRVGLITLPPDWTKQSTYHLIVDEKVGEVQVWHRYRKVYIPVLDAWCLDCIEELVILKAHSESLGALKPKEKSDDEAAQLLYLFQKAHPNIDWARPWTAVAAAPQPEHIVTPEKTARASMNGEAWMPPPPKNLFPDEAVASGVKFGSSAIRQSKGHECNAAVAVRERSGRVTHFERSVGLVTVRSIATLAHLGGCLNFGHAVAVCDAQWKQGSLWKTSSSCKLGLATPPPLKLFFAFTSISHWTFSYVAADVCSFQPFFFYVFLFVLIGLVKRVRNARDLRYEAFKLHQ